MDPVQFFATSRLVIVAGKGGVGKTTVSATLASAAARVGLDTLVVDVEGSSGLPAMFGLDALGYDELTLVEADPSLGRGSIRARTLTADDALIEYLEHHGLKRISKRLVSSGAIDVVATAAPGIKDILLLGKVKQLERSAQPDLIVLDAPAAGHAITFLQSARGLLDAVRVGPIHAQAREVLELLTDPARCRVVLVTLPEETPVNELVETAYQLEDRVGVHLSPIVVNGEYPELDRHRCGPGGRGQGGRRAAADTTRPRRSATPPRSDVTGTTCNVHRSTGSPSSCRSPSSACRSASTATWARPSSPSSPTRCSPASPRSTPRRSGSSAPGATEAAT